MRFWGITTIFHAGPITSNRGWGGNLETTSQKLIIYTKRFKSETYEFLRNYNYISCWPYHKTVSQDLSNNPKMLNLKLMSLWWITTIFHADCITRGGHLKLDSQDLSTWPKYFESKTYEFVRNYNYSSCWPYHREGGNIRTASQNLSI